MGRYLVRTLPGFRQLPSWLYPQRAERKIISLVSLPIRALIPIMGVPPS